jgi:prolyl-tRNA editing enzyme YbaK/EbsC (Cys-tRNA(Pro) deacylase)
MPTILERIRAMLDEHGIDYRHLQHAPTPTSEDSARARGEPIEIGGKALVIKGGEQYHLVVFSAARRLDSGALRRQLGVKKARFASPDELHELTGLVPGSVPPFGTPIIPLPLLVDRSVLANERIAFNAGSLTDSIIMLVGDYERVARIEAVVDVAEESS